MIPKTIHYCWFGGNPIPERDRKCIESWKKFCPDYEICQWNESNYDVRKNRYMRQAYDAGKWGFVPDYARLDIVYREGGIYLDTDVELVRNPDFLLQHRGFAGFERPDRVALGLGFGAEKGSEILKAMMGDYDTLSFLREDGSFEMLPSPAYSTATLERFGFSMDGSLQSREDFWLYPTEYFCPRDYRTGKLTATENTCSIHWFHASWQTPHQRRMRKLRRLLGDETYFRLVAVKNLVTGEKS